MTNEARFWAQVGPHDDLNSCWLWTGAMAGRSPDRPYGCFTVKCLDGAWRMIRTHRFAYEIAYGPIPKGLTIDHLCRNTLCVNPAHLEAVPNKVNVLRGNGRTAINARKTECIRGHAFDGANTKVINGSRECRICMRMRDKKRRNKQSQEAK